MATAHKRYNNLDQLLILGNIVQDPERIQGEIVEFYHENVQWRPGNKFLNCPRLTGEEIEEQERNFDKEILRSLKQCAVDKHQDQMVLQWCSTSNVGKWSRVIS